jgi:hypothetical protein
MTVLRPRLCLGANATFEESALHGEALPPAHAKCGNENANRIAGAHRSLSSPIGCEDHVVGFTGSGMIDA